MEQVETNAKDGRPLTTEEIEQIRQQMSRSLVYRPQVECAVQCRNVAALQQWIQFGYDVNEEDDQRNTIVHYSCKYGNVDVLRCLVRNDANFEARNRNGFTPFLVAVSEGHVELAEWLVEQQKVDHRVKSYMGKTALWIATRRKHDSVVAFLRSLGHELTSEIDENTSASIQIPKRTENETENPRLLQLRTPKWLRKLSVLN